MGRWGNHFMQSDETSEIFDDLVDTWFERLKGDSKLEFNEYISWDDNLIFLIKEIGLEEFFRRLLESVNSFEDLEGLWAPALCAWRVMKDKDLLDHPKWSKVVHFCFVEGAFSIFEKAQLAFDKVLFDDIATNLLR